MRRHQLEQRLRELCRAVAADPAAAASLPAGESGAIALIMDRPALLPFGYTMLYAAWRLEPGWLDVCRDIQRDGWSAR